MVLTLVIFVIILGLLIFVHEFGHFLAAKRSGLTVHEFGFGFPPRLVGFRRKGTIYSLNWIPVGGFVKIKGEDGNNEQEKDSFASLGAFRRIVILLAGVFMNVVLAALLFSVGLVSGTPTALDDGALPANAKVRDRTIQIVAILPDSPAAKAGMAVGDAVVTIDGSTITDVDQLQTYNEGKAGVTETILVRRNKKEQVTLSITPEPLEESEGKAVWGVNLLPVGIVSYPWYESYWRGLVQTGSILWQILSAFTVLLRDLVVHQELTADIAGPVGIAALTGRVANLGFLYLLQFTALLSLNLALVNALPLPALDGGRVLFVIIERIRGRKVNARVESVIHNIGFALLLLLVLLVTIRDVDQLSGGILNLVQRFLGKPGG